MTNPTKPSKERVKVCQCKNSNKIDTEGLPVCLNCGGVINTKQGGKV